jgi:hypothetical protein
LCKEMKMIDLTGERVGRLVLLGYPPYKNAARGNA